MSTDFDLGQQAGYESSIEIALTDMRSSLAGFQLYIGKWNAKKANDWLAIKKANQSGQDLWIAANTALRMIALLETRIQTRNYKQECVEIGGVFETLGSWDMYANFGWDNNATTISEDEDYTPTVSMTESQTIEYERINKIRAMDWPAEIVPFIGKPGVGGSIDKALRAYVIANF